MDGPLDVERVEIHHDSTEQRKDVTAREEEALERSTVEKME